MLKLYLYLFWSNNEDIAVCTTYILSICCNICCIVVTVLLISAHKNVMFTCFSFLPFVTPRGKALKKITYTWLKKSRKKSKNIVRHFFKCFTPRVTQAAFVFFFSFSLLMMWRNLTSDALIYDFTFSWQPEVFSLNFVCALALSSSLFIWWFPSDLLKLHHKQFSKDLKHFLVVRNS